MSPLTAEPPRGRRKAASSRSRAWMKYRLDAIRTDPTSHRIRLQRPLPQLVEEFEGERDPAVIPACADAVLQQHAEAPVRSFVLTLAYREARECLREDECALLTAACA